MYIGIVQSIITAVLGAILGVVVTLFVQRVTRKQQFTEIIYKEKLAVYRQILEQISAIHLEILKNIHYPAQDEAEFKELRRQILELWRIINFGVYVIDIKVYEAVNKLVSLVLYVSMEKFKRIPNGMSKVFADIVKSIREDIGTKPLSNEIEKILEAGFEITNWVKGVKPVKEGNDKSNKNNKERADKTP